MPTKKPSLAIESLKTHLLEIFFNKLNEDKTQVGLELEFVPFRRTEERIDGFVPLFDSGDGLVEMLTRRERRLSVLPEAPADDPLRLSTVAGGQLTFEPGAQLEYSSAPHGSLYGVVRELAQILDELRRHVEPEGLWFLQSGLNPWYRVDEIPLQLNKPRYRHMNHYFASLGPFGQRMMRLSTSLQVNLDVGNAQTAPRRWLVANLLAPIMCATFANSPFCERRFQKVKSYRTIIWQNLDPSRTGFQRGLEAVDYDPCPIQQYLDFALDACCMWLPNRNGELVFDGHYRTFRHWLKCGFHGLYPDFDDWTTHLTTLFPQVRPRGFFEIRYLDAQSQAFWMIPGVILTHILYDAETCERVIELLMPYRTNLSGMMLEAATQGLDEPEIADRAKRVFTLAMDAASRSESQPIMEICESFFRDYTYRNRCPADDLIELNDGRVFSPQQYLDYEARLAEKVRHMALLS